MPIIGVIAGALVAAGVAAIVDWLVDGAAEVDRQAPPWGQTLFTATGGLEVRWAEVPFDGTDGSKVRPVVLVGDTPGGYHVLGATSRNMGPVPGFVAVSSESSGTYDLKAEPSWVDCRRLVSIDFADLRFPRRQGALSPQEANRCLAVLSEFTFGPSA